MITHPTHPMPSLIYGTAWKEAQTCELVTRAITAGFRGIDTAAQPKHYFEKGVGDALQLLKAQGVNREHIFIQTKFTPLAGQDLAWMPYDPNASLAVQVAESFASSQRNLGTDYVDSLVLHSPLRQWHQMMEVWKAMEQVHAQGGAKLLGISNCYDLGVFQLLYDTATVKPKVLQNRFYQDTGYDHELREWCKAHEVRYQSFWTLTANPQILSDPGVKRIAAEREKSAAQVFFRFLTQIGITPLIGARSPNHLREDLEIFTFELTQDEMSVFQTLIGVVVG